MAVAATDAPQSTGEISTPPDARARTEKAVQRFEDTDVVASTTYTWEIRNWMALGERAVSPEFECGGQRFHILLFPQGNPNGHPKTHVALYLEALGPRGDESGASQDAGAKESSSAVKRTASDTDFDSPSLSKQSSEVPESVVSSEGSTARWPHTCASFALSMWNPNHPEVHVTQATSHRYRPKVCDWGYNEFTFMRSAFVRRHGEQAALITPLSGSGSDGGDLGVNITVAIDVLDDPTGVLWHDFADYDSRTETGYTGLVNQGATCYLNSLLQSLYFTRAFRDAVYKIPDSKGVTGGLQRLFYKLSTSQPAVDTTSLTRAFGWDTYDAFTQHDVQELARVLMDRLETKMKGTSVDGVLSQIFVGEMKSYIKCQNVPFESARTEEFWDVQLNVRGMRGVMDSFRAYCAEEMLEGENQYAAGEYGLQDAKKGVVFRKFPPVLHLQLKRYDYDWMNDVEIKINDRYEFPLELDLAEFTESKSGDCKYALHGVLVHSGDLNAGHYYALIKPNAEGGWFRFDDERVTKATLREVLDENFGGEGPGLRRITSAYMLVYVRISDQEFVLGSGDSIPRSVAEQIEAEEKAEALKAQAIAEQQQLMSVSVLDSSTLKHHSGPGVLPWSTRAENEFEMPNTLKVRIGTPLEKFMRDLRAGSLWLVEPPSSSMKARIARGPSRPRLIPQAGYAVEHLAQWSDHANPVVIAAEAGDHTTERFVFIKEWDGKELKLRETSWLKASLPLHESLKLDVSKRSVYLESFTPTVRAPAPNIRSLDARLTPEELGIESADALVFSEHAGVMEYFDDASHLIGLQLYVEGVENSGHELEVSTLDDYATLTKRIAEAVNIQSDRLQLHSMTSPSWRSIAINSDGSNLNQLWLGASGTVSLRVRSLPIPIADFEKLSEVVLYWLPEGYLGREHRREVLAAPGCVCPSLHESNEQVLVTEAIAPKAENQVVWVATYSRRARELENPTVGALAAAQAEGLDILAAPLPPAEVEARKTEGSILATAFQYSQTPARTHGVPFQFAVVPEEIFAKTKQRILELLRKEHDRALEKIKFSVVAESEVKYIDDETILFEELSENASLGIDHPDRRRSVHQQAIHID